MNKKKYVERPNLFNENIKYPLLYYIDSLYPEKLHLLKSNEFKGFVKHMNKHLSPLLFINQSQFFTLLNNNLTIRTCLQSCLASFPRKAYSRLFDSRESTKDLSKIKDESFEQYRVLMKTVLFIFYRISTATHKQDKQLVYDQFLLDIPKLLDIAAIYGESNPQIVTKLIENAYSLHPSYDRDTMDFFNHVEHGKLQQMQRNKSTDVDFSPESLNAQNYGNREKYMIEKVMLILFAVKDILLNLTNFLRFFPKKYVLELATDYKVQQRLIDGVTFFNNQMNSEWKLESYKQKYFALHFEDMRQSMVVYFIEEFKVLKDVIENRVIGAKQVQQYAYNTYETYCLLLQSKKKPYYKEYVKLINNLIEESEQDIFFLSADNIYKSPFNKKNAKSDKTKSAIQFCQQYQLKYRKQHKLGGPVDLDPVLNKNRENMKKFKEIWKDEIERKREEIAKANKQKYRKIQDYELNSYINKLKYGGQHKQYDDQPQQEQFKPVVLPNEYQRLDKSELNLTIKLKEETPKYKAKDQSKDPKDPKNPDLSFSMSHHKQINQRDLSFTLKDEKKAEGSNIDTSFSNTQKEPSMLNMSNISHISHIQHNQGESLQSESLNFKWNDQYQQQFSLQIQLQAIQIKKKVDLDLSF